MDDATLLLWVERGRTLSFLLVALGVVGEFLVDRISSPVVKRRDAAQQTEISRLNKETATARESAAKAEAQATQAGEGTAKALANAAAANERAGKLEVEAASQRERAAKAEKELLEVKKKQAPRWITVEQFVTAFGKARPAKALVEYQAGNEEIAMFASGSVAPALVASGWHLEEAPRPIPSAHPPGIVAAMSEVFLYSNMKSGPSDPLSPIGGLRTAFSACGYPPAIFGNNTLPEDTVLIVIGPKI